ncbi:Ferulic acid 5-hydroxylase 1, putative [Theobroma cacao]|uniref:Ferulic acid 5-hydroxylase 1, putative n=1 Tax=Theobroma cacao TaxID=3641 RepID=A0A061DLR1_THECC|nr:Ferulic acid 5-hydroxylase 1, putative [Theobroma cacao]
MRKLCVMKLFSRKKSESWESVRDEVESLVKAVSANTGKAINMGELIFNLTKNITYRAAFGSSSQEGQEEFIKILQEFSKLFVAFNIADFIPWLSWVDPQGLKTRLKNARHALDRFILTPLSTITFKMRKNNNGCDEGDTDMVDDLLAFYREEAKVNESEDIENSIKLTRDSIKAIIMPRGSEASPTGAGGGGGPGPPSRRIRFGQTHLPKVHVERNRPAAPANSTVAPRDGQTAEDAEVAGYRIPSKSLVMINAWAIGRDKNSWEEPDGFKPSRFLKEGVPDFKGSNFEFIKFGSGRRACPGMKLGLYALDLAVANLLHCFTWELPDGMSPGELDMSDVSGLAGPTASPLIAVPKKRLLCPLLKAKGKPFESLQHLTKIVLSCLILIKFINRNPRCIGIPRSLPQGTSYAVGQSEAETSRERRGLVGFHYACAGYSVYMSRNEGSVDKEEDKPELPACLGFEFVAYRRTPAAGPASASAHVHRSGDLMSFNFQQLNAEDRDIRQPRTHKPTHAVGDDFLHRNANLVASGVAKNMRRVGN